MKTVLFEFEDVTPGDLLILNASDPRGGKTHVKRKILGARQRPVLDADGFIASTETLPADDSGVIARDFRDQIKKDWMPECIEARVKDGTGVLILQCTDVFSNVVFSTEVQGEGATKVKMTEY